MLTRASSVLKSLSGNADNTNSAGKSINALAFKSINPDFCDQLKTLPDGIVIF